MVAVGVATALALLVIVPTMKNTCTLFNSRCMEISYQRQPDGQILVKDPVAGLSYWFDGKFIRSYGPYLPGNCPTLTASSLTAPDKVIGDERVLCEHFNADGECISHSGASTVPTEVTDPTSKAALVSEALEPAFVMNGFTLNGASEGVLCSRARNVVETSFDDVPTKSIKAHIAPGSGAVMSAAELFGVLQTHGVYTPPSEDPEPPVCNGNGYVDSATAMCVCNTGYVGYRCGTKLCVEDGECNQGTCNGGLCECDPGWGGDTCDQKQCATCVNGTCDPLTGECVCSLGFEGENCDIRVCVQTCVNGTCDPSSGLCACDAGWHGVACENKDCVDNCNGRGICLSPDGVCECVSGWEGEACESAVCENDCSMNGECNLETRECECDPGWMGQACAEPVCERSCCTHGTCNDETATCVCDPGWGGVDCSEPDDPLSMAPTCPGW